MELRESKLAAIILTKDEGAHITRCIESIRWCVDRIYVVDSGSLDDTCEKARSMDATVLTKSWVNYSEQFNWAISQVSDEFEWILRIDADEVIDSKLADEITRTVPALSAEVAGLSVARRISFQGKPIRWGGVFPIKVIRLFRRGKGRCEVRWMDEHIIVDGQVLGIAGEILDDNLKPISWWIEKHNGYASREAIDLLNLTYGFMNHDQFYGSARYAEAGIKRWLKESVYSKFPLGARALMYFLYRFFFRLGFLDGRQGIAFHFLQGFWYRYLVDLKVKEVIDCIEVDRKTPTSAIKSKLGIDITTMQRL